MSVFLHARPIAWAWDEPETDGSPGGENVEAFLVFTKKAKEKV